MTETLLSPWDALDEALSSLGATHANVVLVDSEEGVAPGFKTQYPERTYWLELSEPNRVLAAAGMALEGKTVFLASTQFFPATHLYTRIRSALAVPQLSVRVVSAHDSPAYARSGANRQIVEDIGLMRLIPNMAVFAPGDHTSAKALLRLLADVPGPAYIRLSQMKIPPLYEPHDDDFSIGGARLLREGDGVTICACGIMVHEVLKAANILSQQGIDAEVIDCYSIKPFPEQVLLSSARRTGCCVVAEMNGQVEGLGGAVADCLSANYPIPVGTVSMGDHFGQSGTFAELQEYYGLTHREIVGKVAQVWARRRR